MVTSRLGGGSAAAIGAVELLRWSALGQASGPVPLVLAVLAVTAVGFVTDRAERALAQQANRLLGGDAILRSDAPIDDSVREAARAAGLQQTGTVALDSMIRVGDDLRLGDLSALGDGYPLRGAFRLVDAAGGAERNATGIPEPGSVWLSRAGADTLDARVGDRVQHVRHQVADHDHRREVHEEHDDGGCVGSEHAVSPG